MTPGSDAQTRRVAALVVRALAGRGLVPDGPVGRVGVDVQNEIVRDVEWILDGLAALHGEPAWRSPEVVRAFTEGAMAAWSTGRTVEERGRDVEITTRACPIGAAVGREEAACLACQALQEAAARAAWREPALRVTFRKVIGSGDERCVLDVERARAPPTPPPTPAGPQEAFFDRL